MTTANTEGLSVRLRFKAQAAFDSNKRAGRTGPEWAIDQEMEWQAADALDAMTAALKDLLNATDPYAKSPRRDDIGEIDARGRAVKALHAAGYTTTTDDLRAAEARKP